MFLYAEMGQNLQSFAKILIEVNKVANNEIIGVFNDVNLWVRDGYTVETIVKDYWDYKHSKGGKI